MGPTEQSVGRAVSRCSGVDELALFMALTVSMWSPATVLVLPDPVVVCSGYEVVHDLCRKLAGVHYSEMYQATIGFPLVQKLPIQSLHQSSCAILTGHGQAVHHPGALSL